MTSSRLKNCLTRGFYIFAVILLLVVGPGAKVFANATCGSLSDLDCNALYGPWVNWVPDTGGTACGNSDSATTDGVNSNDTQAQQIAQTFIVGLDASQPKTAQDVATDLATKYRIGGMYLINTSDAAAAGFDKGFYDSLNKAAGAPLVAASDEEGAVRRYNYGTVAFPSAAEMAKKPDPAVRTIGKNVGSVMARNGLTADLAPVLDLRDVGQPGRSFSNDPGVVANKAGAFAAGLQDSGITPVFKHFPGFDNTTSGTTDNQKVVMTGSIDKTTEPYKKLLAKYPKAGVMLSNMYVTKLDQDYPSSMNKATVDYLRSNMGFKGLITTDDLSVSSVVNKAGSLGDAVTTALQAGVTMPLFTIDSSSVQAAESSIDKVIGAVQKNSAALAAVSKGTDVIDSFKGISGKSSGAVCCGTTTLAGNSNKAKIWNYFIGKGLSAAGTAGLMGNMSAESSFNPAAQQTPGAWYDMSDRNINQGGKGGVGLVQWDGSRRPAFIRYAEKHGVTQAQLAQGSDQTLGVELDYVWAELHSGYTSTLQALQHDSSPGQAAYDFNRLYEGSSDTMSQIQSNRIAPANAIYKEFNGSSGGSSGSDSSGGSCAGAPVDCSNANGTAKILCAAKAYDSVSYQMGAGHSGAAAWHKGCKTIGPSCYLDCSGLVNVAVYDVFKVELNEDTTSERGDEGKYWQKISFNQLRPGDLVQPNPDHVEIVDHVEGNKVYAFAAHTQDVPQPRQVGEWDDSPDINGPGVVYLRYIGPGVQ